MDSSKFGVVKPAPASRQARRETLAWRRERAAVRRRERSARARGKSIAGDLEAALKEAYDKKKKRAS